MVRIRRGGTREALEWAHTRAGAIGLRSEVVNMVIYDARPLEEESSKRRKLSAIIPDIKIDYFNHIV